MEGLPSKGTPALRIVEQVVHGAAPECLDTYRRLAESGRLDRCEHIGVAARMVYRRCVEFEPHSIPKIADAQVTDLVSLARRQPRTAASDRPNGPLPTCAGSTPPSMILTRGCGQMCWRHPTAPESLTPGLFPC